MTNNHDCASPLVSSPALFYYNAGMACLPSNNQFSNQATAVQIINTVFYTLEKQRPYPQMTPLSQRMHIKIKHAIIGVQMGIEKYAIIIGKLAPTGNQTAG
ncbi:hypothetical protein JW933_06015 [candidate division FCPU426 bacterium]|nr:hypothetical protein [candidate division FCPU426 bacterium]